MKHATQKHAFYEIAVCEGGCLQKANQFSGIGCTCKADVSKLTDHHVW